MARTALRTIVPSGACYIHSCISATVQHPCSGVNGDYFQMHFRNAFSPTEQKKGCVIQTKYQFINIS
jgi:hypothetical protein